MKKSKGKIVFNNSELWDCYNNLAKVIYPVLEQFSEQSKNHTLGGTPNRITLKFTVVKDKENTIDTTEYVLENNESQEDISEIKIVSLETMGEIFNLAIEHMIWTFKTLTYEPKLTADPIDVIEYLGEKIITEEEAREKLFYATDDEFEEFVKLKNKCFLDHDIIKVLNNKYKEQVEIGLEYFAKYFQNLWD